MKKASKILVLCCLALTMLFGIVLTACRDNEPEPQPPVDTTLKLNRTTAELDLYEEVQLSVTDVEGTVAWGSSDKTVATVQNGLVKSVAAGTAVITATIGEKSGYCTVTVVNSFAAPVITFGETELVSDKGEQTHVTASVRYKGNAINNAGEIEWNLSETYNFENNAAAVAAFTVDEDKRGATISFTAYGEAQITASAIVWGIPVERVLQVRVLNQDVEIASALEKTGENYAVTLNPIGVMYQDVRVSEDSVDPRITVKENGTEVPNAEITWLPTQKNVAAFDVSSGKIIAKEDGDLDTDTLVGAYKGNCIKIDVSVKRAEIEFTDADKWIMELKDIPKTNGEFPVDISQLNDSLKGGNLEGNLEAIEIPYKRIGADNVVTHTKQNILKSYDAESKTAILMPPVHAYNMGDMTAVVTTSKAIYTMPMGIYTLVISDAEELDEFGKYTTYQWENEYIWDGYFVLDKDITYNNSQNLLSIGDHTRAFQPFIYAQKKAEVNGYTEHFLDEDCKVNVTSWNSGFFGVFDGCGHVIDGLMIDASESEQNKYASDPADPTCSELGGFIGKLGAASYGDTLRRGTIKNIVFTNAVHGGCSYQSASGAWKLKGTYDSSFLFSVSIGGAVQNVYMQSRLIGCNKGLLGGLPWMIQITAMENVVADVHSEANWNGKNPLGQIANYAEGEYTYLRNLYTVSTGDGGNRINGSLNLSDGDIKAKDSTPEAAFESREALGAYLAEKSLAVLAENGWDVNFWTTDENGAPIPLALMKIGLDFKSVQLDMHEKVQLTANTTETGTVRWTSSNEEVATVDSNGLVKSVADGTAIITAEIDGYTAHCTVTVVNTHTPPIVTINTPNLTISQLNGTATVTADVTYKGNQIEESVTYTWTKLDDNTNGNITFTSDGASATFTGGAYGSATFKVETIVWGQQISAIVNVFVANTNVTLTSSLPAKDDGVHTLTMNMFDQGGNVSTESAGLTLKDGDSDIALSNLTWRTTQEGIVEISGNTITAVGGGTTTLIASYQGVSITIEVTVNKEVKELSDRWTIELKGQTENFEVSVSAISTEIKGIVQKVEIAGYNYYNGDTYDRTDKKDILKEANGDTLILTPPYRYREGMGDTTVVITTTQGVYTMTIGIYTLVISDENELNEFGNYTTQQWARTDVNNYFWDGYFILDSDINCTSDSGYTSFINAHLQDKTWYKYTVNGTEVDASKVGFRGMFDGRGHTISGMKIDNSDDYTNLRGGFIGILNGVTNGRAEERGTIQNVSFVNVNHDANKAGWHDYLYSVSNYGIVRNIYIQAEFFENNGLMGCGSYATQNTAMQNIVISVDSMNSWCNYYNLFGWLYYSSDIQNLYAVTPKTNQDGIGAIKAIEGVTLTESTPEDAFTSKQALGAYLAENGLTVSAENGWDTDFWTTDEDGTPVPIALSRIVLNKSDVQLDMQEKVQLTVDTEIIGTAVWSSSDENVATVDQNGLVRSVAEGTAVITVKIDGYMTYCTVTVANSHTPPEIVVEDVHILQSGGTGTATAIATYKGNPIDEEIDYTWKKLSDNTGDNITFTTNGAVITVTGGAYGSATFEVKATVWGQEISAIVNVFVANTNVTLTSSLPTKGDSDVHTLTMEMFDSNGNPSTESAGLTLKDGDSDIALSNLTWRTTQEGIVEISGNTITAVGGGTTTLIASYQGVSITIEVTVNKEVKELSDRWTIELKGQTENFEVSVSAISTEIKGIVQKVEIAGYNYYNGDTYDRTDKKDILKEANGDTLILTPPYRYREGMGDTTVVITTTQGVYTMPMSIYTFVISNEEELNEFGNYTTQQWARTDVSNYFWDGYFVLDSDINCTSDGGYTSFINAHLQNDQWLKYTVNNAEVDASKVGFRGMFDGRGHTISGMKIGNTTSIRGGLIGILNGVANGRAEERGTIQNVSFTNVAHSGDHWSGYLYSVSTHGVVRNIYIQANSFAANSFMGYGEWATQDTKIQNIMISVNSIESWCNWYNMFGWLYNSADIQNLYVVAPRVNGNGNGAINAKDGMSLIDSTPEDAFTSKAALGDYLADKNLYVTAANGWDMNFWATDSYGAPIPKALTGSGTALSAISLSTVNVNTFDGFMPRVYAWNISSDSALTFASSNESVVTVSPEGLIVARGAGTATVTATANGSAVATMSVTVNDYSGAKGFYDYIALASLDDIERLAALDGSTDKYVLACDIDLNGRVGSIAHNFKGTFDGNGFALKNGKLQIQSSSGDEKKRTLFSGTTSGATIRNLKITGLETITNPDLKPDNVNQTDWQYVGVLDNSQNCTVENVYVQFTVNTNGDATIGDATFGRPSNGKFTNVIVDVTYTGNYTNYASLFIGAWGGGNKLSNVYAIVHTEGDAKFSDIKDTLNTQNSSGDYLLTSSERNYASIDALRTAHSECFAEGGAFTGTFWDGILKA